MSKTFRKPATSRSANKNNSNGSKFANRRLSREGAIKRELDNEVLNY